MLHEKNLLRIEKNLNSACNSDSKILSEKFGISLEKLSLSEKIEVNIDNRVLIVFERRINDFYTNFVNKFNYLQKLNRENEQNLKPHLSNLKSKIFDEAENSNEPLTSVLLALWQLIDDNLEFSVIQEKLTEASTTLMDCNTNSDFIGNNNKILFLVTEKFENRPYFGSFKKFVSIDSDNFRFIIGLIWIK